MSPEEAFRKLEDMGAKQVDNLRKLTKEVTIFVLTKTNIYTLSLGCK